MKSNVLAFMLALALPAGAPQAATLSYGGYSGRVMTPSVLLPEARLTSSGEGFSFNDASDAPGSFCALRTVWFGCAADLDIAFTSPVTDLSFRVSGYQPGDRSELTIVGLGGSVLGSVTLADNLPMLDLSGYGTITALFFDDSSTQAGGLAFSEFSFEQDAAVVPLPAALPLLAGGLGLLAAATRHRRG